VVVKGNTTPFRYAGNNLHKKKQQKESWCRKRTPKIREALHGQQGDRRGKLRSQKRRRREKTGEASLKGRKGGE